MGVIAKWHRQLAAAYFKVNLEMLIFVPAILLIEKTDRWWSGKTGIYESANKKILENIDLTVLSSSAFPKKLLDKFYMIHIVLFVHCLDKYSYIETCSLQWCHNGRDNVSNHQPRECLLNHLIRCRSKETSKLRVTGLCAGSSPETGEFPAQGASNAEDASIWWRHHVLWVRREPWL